MHSPADIYAMVPAQFQREPEAVRVVAQRYFTYESRQVRLMPGIIGDKGTGR